VALFVISGVSAAGKSTAARLLAARFPRGVCVHGDSILDMIVSGRARMTPGASQEALAQLRLRYAAALAVAATFLKDGFDVVVEDVIVGHVLRDFLALVPVDEFHLIFLDPDAEAIARREAGRGKRAYGGKRFSIDGLQRILREETDRMGLWLDTTHLTAEQTVDQILANPATSLVRAGPAGPVRAVPGPAGQDPRDAPARRACW
jgi:chloramphenicol 3-O-phosphotransferase